MNIQNISKKDREVTVTLSADELVKICNVLYGTKDENKNELYFKLYYEMMIARDMCQYGHIDDFCLEHIARARNHCGNGIGRVLTDEDVIIFNSYIENNNMPVAFGNSDWCKIYSKIVGDIESKTIEDWKNRNEE